MAREMTRRFPFGDLAERFDRMFEELGAPETGGWTPAVDVVEDEDKLVVRADVPGIEPEEVRIDVDDDILTISGEHEETTEEKDKRFVRRERRYGSFSRSMRMPPGVDPDAIEASSRNGVVEVTIPRPQPKEAKRIGIKPKS